MLNETTANWVGAFGVALLLLAFILNIAGRLDRTEATYLLLNLTGALVTAYASWIINFIPFVVLEGVWAAVSLVSLIKIASTFQKAESS